MKIYHTETQQDYDALMSELEEKGCEWRNGVKPTQFDKFKDSAPKKIRMAGKVYSQAEIVKKKDFLLDLVGGNSGLIQKTIQ